MSKVAGNKKMKKLIIILFVFLSSFCILFSCKKESRNTLPIAEFTISPETGKVGDLFTFTSLSIDKEDEYELYHRWDLDGDGKFDVVGPNEKVVETTYDMAGTYKITLEVSDSHGWNDETTKLLIVIE